MKLISSLEVEGRTDHDLADLFREVSRKLAQTERGSVDRSNSLASLENINTAQAQAAIAALSEGVARMDRSVVYAFICNPPSEGS